MKKTFLLLSLFAGTLTAWGQSGTRMNLSPASNTQLKSHPLPSEDHAKTLSCVDTLRYPQAKEQILGTNNFYSGFDVWQADNESVSQAFVNSGSMSLTGVEFFGARNSSGAATVVVNAAVYNVDASFIPTTLVGSANVTITATAYGYRFANFASPITVTGNYAIVLKPTNSNGILNLYVNDIAPSQPYDELLARFYSAYASYPNPNNWNTIPTFTSGANNYEALISPIVNYSINTQYTPSATTVCLGTPVTYTNGTTPTGVLSSRMNNYQVFRTFFGTATTDSTYVYDMDNLSPYIWTGTTTYTHPAAGAYDVLLATNGGFWNSCFDYVTHTITVNAIPSAPTVTPGGPTTFCNGGNVTLTSSAASGNVWSNGATTPSITINGSGTYTVSQTVAGCTSPASSSTTVTVNPMDDASFNYSSSTLCTGGSNVTPTAALSGTFSSTAGLSFVSTSTGEIDLAGSSNGTYTVTHTTAGTCPNTATQSITITSAPSASFSYSQSAYCTAAVDPSPNFGSGASGGVFSSTSGLSINNSSGVIDLSASTPGSYTVTNDIAASGACPAVSSTFNVTVNESPTAAISGGGSFCGISSTPLTVTFTGSGPWSITYTDGTTPTTVNGISTNPYTINASANGTYSVTQVIMATCSNTGTGSSVVTLNPNPTVNFSPIPILCEDGAPVTLNATPAGGMFSGTSVVGNTFGPSGVTPGTHTITYNYTDANGCSGSANQSATVSALPVVLLGAFGDMCDYNDPITLSGGVPSGGVYSGNAVSGGVFDPGTAGLGSTAITYSYTDANGCSNNAISSITVDECLGLDASILDDVTIAPNPTTGEFAISTSGNDVITFAVLTEDGKLLVAPKIIANGVEQVSLNAFAKGVYFVRLNSVNGTATKKIVLQ